MIYICKNCGEKFNSKKDGNTFFSHRPKCKRVNLTIIRG